MEYLTISQEDRQNAIADAIVARENEVFSYQLNIDNYTAILASMSDLSNEWPPAILSYKNIVPTNAALVVPDDKIDLVSQYMYRDRIQHLLKTEKIEQAKSIKVLEALKSQLPIDQIVGLVTASKEKMIIQRQKALGN